MDKLAPAETEEMVVSEQRALIWKALRDQLGPNGSRVEAEFVEALRRRALDDDAPVDPYLTDAAKAVELSSEQLAAFLNDLRKHYRINRRAVSRQKERITRTGFTLEEQVLTVETALRMMGLVRNFARLVLFCAHGSTTENNPFESALDCGACGGNEGKPNARAFGRHGQSATGARAAGETRHRYSLRHALPLPGRSTPRPTRCSSSISKTPPTHRKDVARLYDDLRGSRATHQSGALYHASRRRCGAGLNEALGACGGSQCGLARVRPEWGLRHDLIIGRRELTKGLESRRACLLQSLRLSGGSDRPVAGSAPSTAPQVVAQWINMEHYFRPSTTRSMEAGQDLSQRRRTHRHHGRSLSDLRLGLAWQTVMNDESPTMNPCVSDAGRSLAGPA